MRAACELTLMFSKKCLSCRQSFRTVVSYNVEIMPVRVSERSDFIYHMPYQRTNPDGKIRILALHGTPGKLEDFSCLLKPLEKRIPDLDFLSVTFPDLEYSFKNGKFWHSPREKLYLLMQFLDAIKLQDIDILLAHSAGMNVQMLATLHKQLNVKSIVTICGTGFEILPALRPEWLHSSLLPFLKYPSIRPSIIALYDWGLRQSKYEKMNVIEVLSSFQTQYATPHFARNNSPKWINHLKNKGTPRLMIFGEMDKVVPLRYSIKFSKIWGNPDPEDHYVYGGKEDSTVNLIAKTKKSGLPTVVRFQEGGHFVFQQFPETVAEQISEIHKAIK